MSPVETRISTHQTPQDLNRILIEQYKYDIFDFAHSLAIVLRTSPPVHLWNIWLIRKVNIPDFRILVREAERLIRIKERLIRDYHDHLAELSRIENPIFPQEFYVGTANFNSQDDSHKRLVIDQNFRINEILDSKISSLTSIKNVFRRTKGSPAASKNIIGSLWSLIMRDTKRIHIEEIENLIDWFYLRLQNTDYAEEMKNSPTLADISRFLGRGFREFLEQDCREIFHYNYASAQHSPKIYPFQIRFYEREPKFLTMDDEGQNSRLIFPGNVNWP